MTETPFLRGAWATWSAKRIGVATCIRPRTGGSENRKIDAAVALMMAVGRATVEDENQAGLNGFLANPIAF